MIYSFKLYPAESIGVGEITDFEFFLRLVGSSLARVFHSGGNQVEVHPKVKSSSSTAR